MNVRKLVLLASLAAAPVDVVGAQSAPQSALTRTATDTTYGIMLALERFAQSIRRGEPDIRSYRSPELAVALGALTTAARARKFPVAGQAFGPLADFAFDSVEIDRTSKGNETVIVKARAILTSDRRGARRVVLHFRQHTGQWVPVQLDGFVEYLQAQSRRYATKEAQ